MRNDNRTITAQRKATSNRSVTNREAVSVGFSSSVESIGAIDGDLNSEMRYLNARGQMPRSPRTAEKN